MRARLGSKDVRVEVIHKAAPVTAESPIETTNGAQRYQMHQAIESADNGSSSYVRGVGTRATHIEGRQSSDNNKYGLLNYTNPS